MLLKVAKSEVYMSGWVAAMRLVGVGFFIGISILLGVIIGRWLDTKLNTEPALMITGLLLGLLVAFYGVYRMLLPLIGDKGNRGSK